MTTVQNDPLKEALLSVATGAVILFLAGIFANPVPLYTANNDQAQNFIAGIFGQAQAQASGPNGGNASIFTKDSNGGYTPLGMNDIQKFTQNTQSFQLVDTFLNIGTMLGRMVQAMLLGTFAPIAIYATFWQEMASYGAIIFALFTLFSGIWQYSIFYQIAKLINRGTAPW